ncbi:MAG TPA: NAD-glutamate dehydrogenase [Gaiellaceae bacterium]
MTTTRTDEAKEAILEAAVRRARADSGTDADDVERWLRAYYAHVAPEDLADRSDADLAGAALAHWRLMQVRCPGELKLRVYNPTVEEDGWESPHTIVEFVNDDMPFLVDSISMEITRHGSGIHLMIRPIVSVRRDEDGRLQALVGEGGLRESTISVALDRQTDPDLLAELHDDLVRVLGDVRAAVEDWPQMLEQAQAIVRDFQHRPPPVDPEQTAETIDLLEWMRDNFTFLGFREYEIAEEDGEEVLRAVPGSGLGILRESGGEPISASFARLPPDVRRMARHKHLLNLTKANSRATVHRPAYLDYIGVKRFDANGEVVAERRFLGLYTHTAYSATPWEIPVIRLKARHVLERAGLPHGGHDFKALVDIIETYPRDELLQMSEDDLLEIAMGIFNLGERRRVRLFLRRDNFGRFISCLVYIPRDRYNTQNRERIEQILDEELHGATLDYGTRVTESVLARLHYVIHVDPSDPPVWDVARIESRLAAATREWSDDLREALIETLGEEKASVLAHGYADAFPAAYQEDFPAEQAVLDIERIEQLDPSGDLSLSLYVPHYSSPDPLAFKLLRSGQPLMLSDVLPLLENMGVKVTNERPYEIQRRDYPPVWIYDFGLQRQHGEDLDAAEVRGKFQEAFACAWRGEIENDGLNKLVLSAGLRAREIVVLRAIAKYLRQTGMTFSQSYMEGTLAGHPEIAARLVELFELRLDPAREDHDGTALDRAIVKEIDAVASLDEDRILRAFLKVIRAVLRTNWFQAGADGRPKPYLSLKLDSKRVPDLPEPVPLVEVYVYSPRVEAIHLRGGPVARGGIRWSDRREDFRTEVLGLMKAQTVKNAVIVPVGSKGGFVVQQLPADREQQQAEVVACYRTFMCGLLDITDTISGGEVVPPRDVVRHDGDDPYLVVAADKGTAKFSDIANRIAEEYGFWLGDAFASGGSAGYDHKAMAITSRGAWESVKRHFRDMGVDADTAELSAVGIGDMSGDVFGNGMLRSRHLKLVAAFDHRHVFVDPDPSPAASFDERLRLFRLPRSSWADYNTALISRGGGVFPRTAKAIELSPQAQAALGIEAESLTPNELIKAVLRAPVDLLWNGGIGTYVKARAERNAEVGDRANDPVRVDAADLRCRVVGEGGNLGFTQRARVAYALRGGRIFMDAIDNSAGVDTSDHEVNLKILLGGIVDAGGLTTEERNELLHAMTDEVATQVLRDNYFQAQAISTSVAQANPFVGVHERLIRSHEQRGLSRELEALPSDEVLDERQGQGGGLTAPEVAVLLSYTKLGLSHDLLGSSLPDEKAFAGELVRYFPSLIRERFADEIRSHRLRREIIATQVANELVNRCGTTFVFRLRDETGASADDVARAYTAARELYGFRALWEEIESLDGTVAASVQIAMFLKARILLERTARWMLHNLAQPIDVDATVERFAPGAWELSELLPTLLGEAESSAALEWASELQQAGVPAPLARRVAQLVALVPSPDIVRIAESSGLPVAQIAEAYSAIGARLELWWLRERIVALSRDSRWSAMARAALRDDVYAEQAALTAEVMRGPANGEPAAARVEDWVEANKDGVDRCTRVLADIRSGGVADLARLSVAIREIRNLVQSTS